MSCNPFDKCEQFSDRRSEIVLKENKSKYIGANPKGKKITNLTVENCLIDQSDEQCDHLLLNCDENVAYFIELKGSDLLKAIGQIDKSLDKLLGELSEFKSINARIVLTKTQTPDINSSKEINLRKRLAQLKGNLKRGNSPLKETL